MVCAVKNRDCRLNITARIGFIGNSRYCYSNGFRLDFKSRASADGVVSACNVGQCNSCRAGISVVCIADRVFTCGNFGCAVVNRDCRLNITARIGFIGNRGYCCGNNFGIDDQAIADGYIYRFIGAVLCSCDDDIIRTRIDGVGNGLTVLLIGNIKACYGCPRNGECLYCVVIGVGLRSGVECDIGFHRPFGG